MRGIVASDFSFLALPDLEQYPHFMSHASSKFSPLRELSWMLSKRSSKVGQ